jgi:uncharacterized protein YxeA
MKRSFFYICFIIIIIAATRVFAQTASNTDFDPFPQMEQDQKNIDDGAAAVPQAQNDDWPPANDGAQVNGEGTHD